MGCILEVSSSKFCLLFRYMIKLIGYINLFGLSYQIYARDKFVIRSVKKVQISFLSFIKQQLPKG